MSSDHAVLGLRRCARSPGAGGSPGQWPHPQGWQVALLEPSQDSARPQALGRTSSPAARKGSRAQRNEPLPPQAGRRRTLTAPCQVA